MRAYTLNELMILTRAELFALHRSIADALALPRSTRMRGEGRFT
jgi:hypothetical protein